MAHIIQSGTDHTPELKPLTLVPSMLYFGLPALLFVFGFWAAMPWLIGQGMLSYYTNLLGVGSPLVLLLAALLLRLKLKGRAVNWETARVRLRLHPMNGKIWLWLLAALLLGSVVGFGGVSQMNRWLIAQGMNPIPAAISDFSNPTTQTDPMLARRRCGWGARQLAAVGWMEKLGIIYFIGAGNTAWVANRLAAQLCALGDAATAFSYEETPAAQLDMAAWDVLGIAFPVYSSFAAPVFHDYLEQLSPADKPLFAVTTAGYWACDTAWYAAQPLARRGYRLFFLRQRADAEQLFHPQDELFARDPAEARAALSKTGHAACSAPGRAHSRARAPY